MSFSWTALAERARLAPTPHNAQPYRLRLPHDDGTGTATVVIDCDRILVEEDRDNRYVACGLGIFLRTLEVAAKAQGYALACDLLPDADRIDIKDLGNSSGCVDVVTVAVTGAVAAADDAALDERVTSRLPFAPIDEASLAFLAALERGPHTLRQFAKPGIVEAVLRRNAMAIIDNLQIDEERRELWRWTHLGNPPAVGDGLYGAALNQPTWEILLGFLLPRVLRVPLIRRITVARQMAKTKASTLLTLSGPFSTDAECIAAGRVLMDLWLLLAKHGVASCPLGSPMTSREHRPQLERELGVDATSIARDGPLWMLLRVGLSAEPVRGPRLPSLVLAASTTTENE